MELKHLDIQPPILFTDFESKFKNEKMSVLAIAQILVVNGEPE